MTTLETVMLSVANKPFVMSAIILSVVMLNVIMLCAVILNVIIPNVVAPSSNLLYLISLTCHENQVNLVQTE
jgi:hypothetical protein